ncbi:MAG: type II toxin-antitoxin system PemK/MazF family toxin [Gammaproteobacteria bacterium]|nr:MAG: type II toxin-antitoxin system PemK/MazF family toxin [Gammaproteobacteria bacterium]
MGMVKRGEVYWVNLDPAFGTEIKKTRPALIISPDDMNAALPRVIIAPLTSKGQPLGCRPEVTFNRRSSRILLDQVRSVDKRRLLDKLGEIDQALWHPVLLEMLT